MLMTPEAAAALTINEVAGLSPAEFAEYKAHERVYAIDLVLEPNQEVEDVLLADEPLRREWASLYRRAEAKNELGELEYEVDVDVTASPDQPDRVEVGTLKIAVGSCSERFPVVLECKAGVEDVLGRKVMRFVGRVCR